MKKVFFIIICLYCFPAFSGGGSVVGNGAGTVESSFQQMYYSLTKIIPSCSAVVKCDLTRDEKSVLAQILKIINLNENKKDRLVFLSEKLNPGFFTTGSSEVFRIAKTYLNQNSPIFVNTDLLYTEDGRPAIKLQDVVRILIHEIGHQTGIEDHASLDILGSKVASYSEESTFYYRYKIEEDNSSVSFAVTNLEQPIKSSVVVFNWKNSKLHDLTGPISAAITCNFLSESYAGIEISNGHFILSENGLLSLNAWVDISCYDSSSTQMNIYRKDLIVSLDSLYKLQDIQVK